MACSKRGQAAMAVTVSTLVYSPSRR